VTTQEWLALNLAAAPPLTRAQIAALRPIFAPVIPHMKAAPAATRAAPQNPAPPQPLRRSMQ
jgi:hypothetical protein